MNRIVACVIGGALFVGVAGFMVAIAEQSSSRVFIPGDSPITEDQVRTKLQSDGWSNISIVNDGKYFVATGSRNGQAGTVSVESQTGRLRGTDADGDDD